MAIIKAWCGDQEGNLVYRKTVRDFNRSWRRQPELWLRRWNGACALEG